MDNKIKCLIFKPHTGSVGLLGFADIFIPKMGIEIYGCTMFRNQQTGHRFLNLPSKEYTDQEGQKKYAPIIRFVEKEHYNAFQNLVVKAIDEWCAANQEQAVNHERQPEPQSDDGLPF